MREWENAARAADGRTQGRKSREHGERGDRMMRRQVNGSLLAILFALIAGLGVPAAVPAAQAAPQDGAGPGEALTTTQSLSAVDGPSGHFAFGRVAGQATPTGTLQV